jgi:hypothetical protein
VSYIQPRGVHEVPKLLTWSAAHIRHMPRAVSLTRRNVSSLRFRSPPLLTKEANAAGNKVQASDDNASCA